MGDVELRPIRAGEELELFELFGRVVGAKEGYPHAPPLTATPSTRRG